MLIWVYDKWEDVLIVCLWVLHVHIQVTDIHMHGEKCELGPDNGNFYVDTTRLYFLPSPPGKSTSSFFVPKVF